MRKKSSVSFSSLRTGHVIEILAGIVYPLERLLEAALGKTEYTIRRALIVCAFSAALEIVFVLMITMTRKEREERLAFLMPMASYATVLIGSFVTADFEFFFLITLALFVISCVYQNFFRNLQFFVVSNALNVFLFVFYFPSLDVSVTRVSYSSTRIDPAGILIIDWFIAFAASFALLILTHLLTRRSGAANRGLMSFDTLLQTTPNYTVLVDEMKQVLYISEPLARFAHIADRRMARGRPLLDLFGERSLKLLFYDVIDSEGPFDETREIAVDGETRHFKIIADELTGEVNGMFIDVTDITPVIAAKLEADDARDAAEQANRAKSDFLARMSHEIRTPMNAIIGMGDLMRTDNLDQTQTGYFDDIKRSSKALLQIINDILDFSKVEAGKLDILPVDFSLRTLYDNLCSLNTFTAGVKDLDFLSRMGEDVPDIVFGDEIRVRQIVTNLLNNAVKYTRRGYVSFTMRKAPELGESFVGFVVEDSGVGIREEDMSRLFGTFEQFDVAANRGIVGSGLGLSIVKRLTDLMGGRVEVASEYGKGSRFAVYLPLPPGDPEKIEQSYDITRVIADSGTSVLVVDDNDMNINVARAFLATHGIEADIARSGYEAIDKVRDGHYDLVFMDHMMPEIDGLKATQIIRGFEDIRFRSIPIIALTANAVVGERKAFLTAGMSDYLAKPIMAPDMNRMLQKWLPPERILRYENIRTNAAGERVERGVGADGGMLINRTVGLERSAKNEKLYAQLLRDFVKNHRDTFKRITQGLVDGDIALAHRLAHTLKSTAWMIGAEALGDAALAVEEGLSNGELHCTDSQLFSLRQELGFVIAEIGVEERAGSAADEFDWDAGSGGSNAGGANAGGGAGANANGKPGGGLNTNIAADADEPKAAPGASGGTDAAPDGDAASEREVAVPFSVARALDLMDRLDPLIRSHRTAAADLSEEIVETLGPLGEGAAELAGQLENYRFGDAAELLRALRERVRSASSGQLDGSCGDRGGANRDSGGE